MRVLVFLMFALAMPGIALPDAANGEFIGYRLGDSCQWSVHTRERVTTSGNLAITAENPVKPADVGDVTLVVTPETLTVGDISALT